MRTFASHLAAAILFAFASAAAAGAAPAAAPEPSGGGGGPMGRVLVGEEVSSYVRMESVRSAIVV
ncbi:MAG: hypothetical protein ACOC05_07970, partial [Oceanicaulis sp.]